MARHMRQNKHIGISRKVEWIESRVRNMYDSFEKPMFVTMDGSRFDSTQHWWMR